MGARFQPVGLYIVAGGALPPAAVLLSDGAVALYLDRCRVAGSDAGRRATFGQLADIALPATDAALCYIMERALLDALPFPAELAAMAAAIATGSPMGSGKDYGDATGGQRVPATPAPPRKPAPAGRALPALSVQS